MRTLKEVDDLRQRLIAEGVPLLEAVRIIAEAHLFESYLIEDFLRSI